MTKTFALGRCAPLYLTKSLPMNVLLNGDHVCNRRINPKDGKPYDGLFVGFVGTKLNLNKPSPKGIV